MSDWRPMFRVTAPGLDFAFTPKDNEDLELVRVACADAKRRVRQAMRFSLPESPEDADER